MTNNLQPCVSIIFNSHVTLEAASLAKEPKAYFFRPYEPEDIPFIQSSWGYSYYGGVNGNHLLSPQDFHKRHRPIRDKILSNPKTAIIVCVAKESPGLIIGYMILEKPENSQGIILHYIYVKHAFKGENIGQDLIAQIKDRPVLYTHSTIQAGKIINKFKANNRTELERFLFAPHII